MANPLLTQPMYQQTRRDGVPFDPFLDQKRAQQADARQMVAILRQQAPQPVSSGMSLPQISTAQQITPRSDLSPEQLAYARDFTNRPAQTSGPTSTLMPMAPGVTPQSGGAQNMLYWPGGAPQGKPQPAPVPTDTPPATVPTSFSIPDIYAQFGLPMNGDDAAYWANRQQQGVSQQNVSTSIPAANAAFQQLLGRDMQAGVMEHVDPILQATGVQGMRQYLAASPEYQTRMLGPASAPWQEAARQATAHQAMMPGSFWDYTNPALGNPAAAQGLMAPKHPISQAVFGAINDPESDLVKGLLGDLLGTKDDKDKKKAEQRSESEGEGMNFIDRHRAAYQKSRGRA